MAEASWKWMKQAMDDDDDVYLLADYHTSLDTHIVEGINSASAINSQVGLPITVSLAA